MLRIRIQYDDYPEMSYLEQWDTPEKYYGKAPACTNPGCDNEGYPMTYKHKEDHSWICEECGAETEWDGEGTSMSGTVVGEDGQKVSFTEYMKYWGNPDRHVVLLATVERGCDHCGSWVFMSSVGGIDFMDDGGDWETGTFQEDELDNLPKGYLKELAKELIDEVRKEMDDAA